MSYTALYRRYRPQTFAALIGQPHIAKVLSAAVRRGNFIHAYLFCGPRGTGKTSTARILARAINCQHPAEDGSPCNQCDSCQRALNGESLDIIEIDGASNRGIDEIRDLRERVKYAPAQERYKIYIIDEVHMLTNDAFNAILKTLEEPPAHVIFIFATTAPHKLPMTVLSRCQRFDFRRISEEEISAHLLEIAAKEQIDIEREAAELIARKADGGMRDAVSLLDQCAAASEGPVTTAAVTAILGIVDQQFIRDLAEQLLQKDIRAALQSVETLVNSGKDLRQAVADLCEELRDRLLEVLAQPQTNAYPPQAYLDLLTALTDADNRLRHAAAPRITLELALIRACALNAPPAPTQPAPRQPSQTVRKTAQPTAKRPAPAQQTGPTQQTAPAQQAAPAQQTAPAQSSKPAEPAPANKAAAAAKSDTSTADQPPVMTAQQVVERWQEVLDELEKLNPSAFYRMENCQPQAKAANELLLLFPADRDGDYQYIHGNKDQKQVIATAIEHICGQRLKLSGAVGDFQTPELAEQNAEELFPAQEQEQEPGEIQLEQESLF